jgi:SAM-dependent methyltransferase
VGGGGRTYPIVRSVPRFVPSEEYSDTFGYQWNLFPTTQLDSASARSESRDAFVQKTGLSLQELRGKLVLDVGCGMGRFAEVVAEAGARVVGVDLSRAVDAAASNLARFENAAVVQADLFSPPFATEAFDVIYSIGVLHHTPNTRKAFLSLIPHLRKGGRIAIWVYSRSLRWRTVMSVLYRLGTTRISRERLSRWSRIAGPVGEVQRLRGIGRPLKFLLPLSAHPDPEWRILETFDWYSPKFQWTHTQPQVEDWFHEAGLRDLWRGQFPVSVAGTKP